MMSAMRGKKGKGYMCQVVSIPHGNSRKGVHIWWETGAASPWTSLLIVIMENLEPKESYFLDSLK